MFEQFDNLTIRNATVEDADLLSAWWNDGKLWLMRGFRMERMKHRNVLLKKYQKMKIICRRLKNQLGELQSSVDYELVEEKFNAFNKQ